MNAQELLQIADSLKAVDEALDKEIEEGNISEEEKAEFMDAINVLIRGMTSEDKVVRRETKMAAEGLKEFIDKYNASVAQ